MTLRPLAIIGVLVLGWACRPVPTVLVDYGRTPVLLVHGLGEEPGIWRPFVRHLERAGYPPGYIAAIELAPGGANAIAAREEIVPAVSRLLEAARRIADTNGAPLPNKVDIVAHSMGALSARYYVSELQPERVRTLITMAGANHGSNRFCDGGEPPGAREMCPAFATGPEEALQMVLNGSPDLPRDETPWGLGEDGPGVSRIEPDSQRAIRYGTVDSQSEVWIVPDSSTRLAGSGGWHLEPTLPPGATRLGAGRFVVDGTDHDAIVHHKPAMRLVEALLRQ